MGDCRIKIKFYREQKHTKHSETMGAENSNNSQQPREDFETASAVSTASSAQPEKRVSKPQKKNQREVVVFDFGCSLTMVSVDKDVYAF